MRCPDCEESGFRHCVTEEGKTEPFVMRRAYWDEDNKYHPAVLSKETELYFCSNGHHWTVEK